MQSYIVYSLLSVPKRCGRLNLILGCRTSYLIAGEALTVRVPCPSGKLLCLPTWRFSYRRPTYLSFGGYRGTHQVAMSVPKEGVSWDFEKLTDAISYHRKPPGNQSRHGVSLVVLCTWMSANRRHIAKYTDQYRTQYPGADILVVESSIADIFYRSNQTQQHRLRPAHDILHSHITGPAKDLDRGQVLLHVFSNGGAQCAVQLATGLLPEHRRLAFNAIIFDSCPGEATYQRSVHAMTLSLPKSAIAKYLGPLLIHVTLCFFYIAIFISGFETVITRSRRLLNDPAMFGVTVPRLYIYSEADQLVPHEGVISHADDAEQKGYSSIQQLLFKNSGHCAHAVAHKDQYWKAVEILAGEMKPTREH